MKFSRRTFVLVPTLLRRRGVAEVPGRVEEGHQPQRLTLALNFVAART